MSIAVDVRPELEAAADWRLLALLLSRPRPGWREEVSALSRERPENAPRAEEPNDHLSVQCDFVAYLFLKGAYARARGDEEAAAVTQEARTRFIADHVALVGHGFARKLPEEAPAHLVGAARCLVERLPAPPAADGGGDSEDDPLGEGCPAACGDCPG